MGLGARFLGLGGSPFDDRMYTPGPVIDFTGAGGVTGPLKVSTVWRAVNVLAAGVAVLPLDVLRQLYDQDGKKTGREIVRKDPRRRLLRRRPNNLQTSYRMRHHMMGHLLLGGNYYLHKVGDPRFPQQLWPLTPERTRVTNIERDGSLTYEYRTAQGKTEILPQRQVIHLRGFSLDGVTGVNVFDLMRDTTSLALGGRTQRAAFMRNSMTPSAVISHPKAIGPDAETNIAKGYKKAFGGPRKAGDVLVLGEGATISPFTMTSRDAQYVEGEHFLIEEFLRFIGVPGVLAGYADKTSTYASAEQFFQSFITHGLMPWTTNIEAELGFALFDEEEDEDIGARFNLDAMLRGDSAARAAFYRAMVELGIMTRNEVRELEGRDPLEGLDEPLTPMNMSAGNQPAAGAATPTPAPRRLPEPEPPAEDDDEEDARARRITRRAVARLVRREVLAVAGAPGRKGLAERFAKDPTGFAAEVRAFYERHAEILAEELELPLAVALAYCAEQERALLSAGLSVLDKWETERAAALERMALRAA